MSEERFGFDKLVSIVDKMPIALLVCSKTKHIVFCNDLLYKVMNLPKENLLHAYLPELEAEGLVTNSATLQVYKSRKQEIKYVSGKYVPIPVLTISTPVFDVNGNIDYVIATSIDECVLEDVSNEMVRNRVQAMQALELLSSQSGKAQPVIAESQAMKKILAYVSRCAQLDSTIMVLGETGTGKDVVAKYIHNHSTRSNGVFVPVNCAAIPEPLMEAECFGYASGAFTGANREGKLGYFELANGGTLFLDEIGDMPLALQAKFLRVIETGEVTRLGAVTSKKISFRLVAATNRNLIEMCDEGKFRLDLYYRLNILSVELPPLRERKEDIIPLAQTFLSQLNKKYSFQKILSHSAHNDLLNYAWPGNVRELRNVIERMVATSQSDILNFLPDAKHICVNSYPYMPQGERRYRSQHIDGTRESLRVSMQTYERQIILECLKQHDGNVAKSAEALGIHRTVLYRKIKKF